MNTRIACLLLFVIAHAPASAAPKFPLKRHAAIEFFRNGKFAPGLGGVRIALTWSPDGKTLASNGIQTKINDRGQKESVHQLLLWDAVNWGRKPKERILINKGEVVMDVDFFDPKDSNRLALDSREGCGILNLKRPKDKPRLIKKKHFMRRVGQIGAQGTNWSRDGKKVAFNSSPVISIVDPENGKTLHTLNPANALEVLSPGHADFGLFEDWSPDGKYLVTNVRNNAHKSVVVFDNKLEEELFRFEPYGPNANNNQDAPFSVKWNPQGTEIAFLGIRKNNDFYVSFLDMKGLEANEDEVGAPSRYKRDKPDRSFLMKGGEGNPIVGPLMLAWGSQGRRIALAASSREKRPGGGLRFIPTIFIYSKGGTLLHEFVVRDVFVHPDDRSSGGVRVVRLEWSPDGFKIAAGLTDGTIRVFKTPK